MNPDRTRPGPRGHGPYGWELTGRTGYEVDPDDLPTRPSVRWERGASGWDGYGGHTDPAPAPQPGVLVRAMRAVSGSIAAGLVVLALVVAVAQVLGGQRDFPGPGAESVTVHLLGAAAALAAQRLADRRTGLIAVVAALTVAAIAVAVLFTQWWG